MSENNTCWLCLDESSEANPCLSNCACPSRASHSSCLQRWQLQCAGSMEETQCRFCNAPYATGWRTMSNTASIFSRPSSPSKPPRPAEAAWPRIKVNGPNNRHIMLPLRPGDEGKAQFEREVRAFLKLGPEAKININFEAKVPSSLAKQSSRGSSSHAAASSEMVRLDGFKTYDAAFHCASLAAEERRTSFTTSAKPNCNASSQYGSSPATSFNRQSMGLVGGSSGGGGNDVGRKRPDQIQIQPSMANALPPKPSAGTKPQKMGKSNASGGGGGKGWMSKMMDLVTLRSLSSSSSSRDQGKNAKVWVFHQSPQAF